MKQRLPLSEYLRERIAEQADGCWLWAVVFALAEAWAAA